MLQTLYPQLLEPLFARLQHSADATEALSRQVMADLRA
jgi:hypothetical protein